MRGVLEGCCGSFSMSGDSMENSRRSVLIGALGAALMPLASGARGRSQAGQNESRERPKLPPGRVGRVLVVAETKGFEHDSIPDAMANVWRMGHDTRLWETTLRTDTELVTKKEIKDRNVKNLSYFDALVFASTTGELDMDDSQKQDMMSFIKDDGK